MADKRLVYIILLASAMTLLALAMGAAAQTPPPASGTWNIYDDTTMSNTAIEIADGDIYVYSGGSLTLTNVNLNFFKNSGIGKFQVYAGGSLVVEGGSITFTTGTMRYPPQFLLYSPCSFNGTTIADLSTFNINSWGTSVTNCTVTHSTYGMFYVAPSASSSPSDGPIIIANNSVPMSDRTGIGARIQNFSTEKGRLVISDNYLWSIGDDGIDVTAVCDAAEIIVEDNILGSIDGDGIVLDLKVKDLTLRFDGNSIQDANGDGVRLLMDFDTLDFPGIDGLRSVNADMMCLRITLMYDFMDNVTFSDLDVQDGGLGGVSFNGVLNATVIDSSIDCPSSTDFVIARSTVEVFRTSHQQGDATVAYAISSISSWKTLNLTCQWQWAEPVSDTRMDLLDSQSKIVGTGTTDANGYWGRQDIMDWSKTTTGSTIIDRVRPVLIHPTGNLTADDIILDKDMDGIVIFRDEVLPVLTVTSPLGALLQNTTDLLVTGTCTDPLSGPHSVQVSIDPNPEWALKTWIDATGTEDWSITLTDLPDGNHTLYVRAWDRASYPTGFHANVTVPGIVIDTMAPVIDISYPAHSGSDTTMSPTFLVEGNISEEVTEFYLSGELTTITGTSFSITVDLVEGMNTIDFAAMDLAGNFGEATTIFEVIYDPVPPVIDITSPLSGALLDSNSVIVQGTVNKEMRDGQVLVNGVAVDLNGNTFEHLIINLDEGTTSISVSGFDLAGNAGLASVNIDVDTIAPLVTITSPENGLLTSESTVTVAGTVSETGTSVTVNGVQATVTGTDFTYSLVLLEEDNSITVTATDMATNQDQATITVTLDTIAPSLTLHGLDNGTLTTKGDTQDVSGTTDMGATVTLVVGGVEMTAHVNPDGTFRHTITITDTETLVTVHAEDLIGNTATEDVLIYQRKAANVPDEAPILTPEQTTAVALATTSLIILGAAVSIEATKYSLLLLFLPLYARLKKDAVLDNKTRLALHGLVVENPGMHYNEIIREFGLTNGVAAYHLDVLEREGFVRSVRDGTKRRFYSTTTKVPEDTKLTPDQTRDYILNLITDKPGISQKEIVDELGIGRTLVGYHLKTLIDDGYIKASRKGRFTVYSRTQKRWFQMT